MLNAEQEAKRDLKTGRLSLNCQKCFAVAHVSATGMAPTELAWVSCYHVPRQYMGSVISLGSKVGPIRTRRGGMKDRERLSMGRLPVRVARVRNRFSPEENWRYCCRRWSWG